MLKENIFIHIPKTGGTTLNCAINNSEWQTKHDFFYRHIIYETKFSNSGDIFKPQNLDKYKAYNIFTMLRHPVDRLISEYYFIRNRKEFFSLLKKKPDSLKSYAQNVQTQNYMTGFLLGGKMYPAKPVAKSDLERVLNTIDQLPVFVGIFEDYVGSMQYFEDNISVKWPKKIQAKRITLNRPDLERVDSEIRSIIEENNPLDMELYNHCKQKFEAGRNKSKFKITIEKDKYNYVMKYTQRFILAELFMVNRRYIANQESFFRDLNLYLHQYIKPDEGETYVLSWNQSVVNTIKELQKETFVNNNDLPLDSTEFICQQLDKLAKINKGFLKRTIEFDPTKVKIIKYEPPKTSLFSKLFGKK